MELNMKYRYNAITGEMCKQDFPETHAENIIIVTNDKNVVFWDNESKDIVSRRNVIADYSISDDKKSITIWCYGESDNKRIYEITYSNVPFHICIPTKYDKESFLINVPEPEDEYED